MKTVREYLEERISAFESINDEDIKDCIFRGAIFEVFSMARTFGDEDLEKRAERQSFRSYGLEFSDLQ